MQGVSELISLGEGRMEWVNESCDVETSPNEEGWPCRVPHRVASVSLKGAEFSWLMQRGAPWGEK